MVSFFTKNILVEENSLIISDCFSLIFLDYTRFIFVALVSAYKREKKQGTERKTGQ